MLPVTFAISISSSLELVLELSLQEKKPYNIIGICTIVEKLLPISLSDQIYLTMKFILVSRKHII